MWTIGGPGLEWVMVFGAAGVHLLITGLALGHCSITEFVASCELGGALLTGLHEQKKKMKSKFKCLLIDLLGTLFWVWFLDDCEVVLASVFHVGS